MSEPSPLSADASTEFEAIEATMRASARGRRFLAEYARRNRVADTATVLDAIRRLERTATAERDAVGVGQVRGGLLDMAEAISRTKTEIAAISAPDHERTRLSLASLALDAIVRATEQATSDILGSAEAIQEAAWSLRERGTDPGACDDLDRHATAIYTACSFQDLTAQRIARIVYTLRYLEDRLSAMIAIWEDGAEPVPQPAATGSPALQPDDLCQSDVDRYIAMEVPAVTAAAIVARSGGPALHEDIVFVPVPQEGGPADGDRPDAAPLPEAHGEAVYPQDAPEDAHGPAASAPEAPARFDEAAQPQGPAPVLGLAEIDALPPEERLALFS